MNLKEPNTTMDNKERLELRIRESVVDGPTQDFLLRRLKVASHEGVAAIVRDFEAAIVEVRKKVLQSHRLRHAARGLNFRNKSMLITQTA